MKCDFCTVPLSEDHTVFSATDFIVEECPIAMSKGDWLACPECAELLDSEQWGAIAIRAYSKIESFSNMPKDVAMEFLTKLYSQFRKHRSAELAE